MENKFDKKLSLLGGIIGIVGIVIFIVFILGIFAVLCLFDVDNNAIQACKLFDLL